MLSSPRLRYESLTEDHLDRFHSLVQDAHIRRYLMDGVIMPREWGEERVRESEELMATRGVGLWLAIDKVTSKLAGFCGFLVISSAQSMPQLVYALREPFAGKGYAVEMARACIEDARENAAFTDIIAAVDEVNGASVRVLEKLGFERGPRSQGAFGNMFTYTLRR